ncbi:MAG: hypothetical protein FGM28_11025, partial [Limnohabitans sp.]|nr:hypothetical protein [Limnohabitans sp.]
MITARYINMENAIQRRVTFEENVRLVNLPFPITRFPAKQIQSGNDFLTRGEIGCFLSHVEATLECNESDLLLIFEDDSIITKSFKKIIPSLISQHENGGIPDIVFFNGGINTHNINHIKKMLNHVEKIGDFSLNEYSNFQLISAQELYIHGSSAYAISAKGRQKIKNNY